jgi:hypothetical protein
MRPTQAVLDWLLKVAPEFGASMTLQEVQEDTDVYLIPDDSITLESAPIIPPSASMP